MADSVRQKLAAAVKTRMQTITVANGYETNIGQKAFLWKTGDWQTGELPGVNIVDTVDSVTYATMGTQTEAHAITFEAIAVCASGATSGEFARKMAADIQKAIGTDGNWTVSGTRLGFDTQIKSIFLGVDQDNKAFAIAKVVFEIKSRMLRFDPYTARN